VELDPLSGELLSVLAFRLLNNGRADEASETLARLRRIGWEPIDDQYYGRVLLQKNHPAEAITYFGGPGSDGFRSVADGLLGRHDEAESLRKTEQFPNQLALICASLGDKDCVFDSLNRMADLKDPRIHYYIGFPELALIRGDLRLGELRKKI